MARKSTLFGGRTVKVENRSGFDKSFLNMLTTGVGTITPIVRQLVIPSSGKVKVPVHVELPPLAADAYLRTHLKLEAFYVPLRICYGGFSSWFSGDPVWSDASNVGVRAGLPYGLIPHHFHDEAEDKDYPIIPSDAKEMFGACTLTDYFDIRFDLDGSGNPYIPDLGINSGPQMSGGSYIAGKPVNLFPYLCYHLIYDHFYRNKSVTKPGFMNQGISRLSLPTKVNNVGHLPFQASIVDQFCVILGAEAETDDGGVNDSFANHIDDSDLDDLSSDRLLNGHCLWELRQRNFGDDYFTAARPQAQAGDPVYVQTDANGRFTIQSIRLQNALQEFAENQNYATPDYIQSVVARYGVTISDGLAQKPVCLASADFPIFTKSVEANAAQYDGDVSDNSWRNPFTTRGMLGAKAGNANGNGVFSFDFSVNEPGYIMVMATLVPEANYSSGISKEMEIFTKGSESLVDLPCGLLEHVGDEPIMATELYSSADFRNVFGYVQRYLWHKAGNVNQIHGLFRRGLSLQAFVPQRNFTDDVEISSNFLEVPTTALDDVAAVDSGISEFGVLIDCAVEMFVSEPLSESALPALVNPASEHGKSVYLKNGGSKLA